MDKKCSIGSCNRKHVAKGYCDFHYRSEYLGKRKCIITKCKNKQHGRGYCYTHYIKSHNIKCLVENCTNAIHSNGICQNHYNINKRKIDSTYAEKQNELVRKWRMNHPKYDKNRWIKHKKEK